MKLMNTMNKTVTYVTMESSHGNSPVDIKSLIDYAVQRQDALFSMSITFSLNRIWLTMFWIRNSI